MSTARKMDDSETSRPVPFGKEMAKHFLFKEGYKNLNHGMSNHCYVSLTIPELLCETRLQC